MNSKDKIKALKMMQRLQHTILTAQAHCNSDSFEYKGLDVALHELADLKDLLKEMLFDTN